MQVESKVTLLHSTPLYLAASGARLCYKSEGDSIDGEVGEKDKILLDNLVKMGHGSVVEHVNYTFLIENVSRSLTHQLVRHRHASYSQESQRYVKYTDFDYVIPQSFIDKGLEEEYNSFMEHVNSFYNVLTDISGIPKEDARYIFPNAITSSIQVTMNFRGLHNFFKERLGKTAQWEIRELAQKMLDILPEDDKRVMQKALEYKKI